MPDLSFSSFSPGTRVARQDADRHAGAWRSAVLLTTAALAVVVVLDLTTPPDFRPRTLLGLLPIGVAIVAPVLVTAVSSAFVLLSYFVLGAAVAPPEHSWGVLGPVLIASGGVLGVAIARVREGQQRRLKAVTDVAETIQQAVLRPMPHRIRDLRIADLYRPAERAARVGGDWYDVQPSPHGVRAVLGDVSGKGLPAVTASVSLLGAFREAAYHERDLAEVARHLEVAMQRYNVWARYAAPGHRTVPGGAESAELFSTAVLLDFAAPDTVDLIAFGHEPPLLVRDGQVREPALEPGLPLGMGELTGRPPVASRVPFRVGDTLVLFTDGVSECRDADGVFYPVRERLRHLVETAPGGVTPPPQALLDGLARDLAAHRGGPLADDAAIAVIRREAVCPVLVDPDVARLYYRQQSCGQQSFQDGHGSVQLGTDRPPVST